MKAKQQVLLFVGERGPVDAATVAACLGYDTVGGAGAMLLRFHRHGHLHRVRADTGYLYSLSAKGSQWLAWYSHDREDEGEVDAIDE
jgi:hypothetical protein